MRKQLFVSLNLTVCHIYKRLPHSIKLYYWRFITGWSFVSYPGHAKYWEGGAWMNDPMQNEPNFRISFVILIDREHYNGSIKLKFEEWKEKSRYTSWDSCNPLQLRYCPVLERRKVFFKIRNELYASGEVKSSDNETL